MSRPAFDSDEASCRSFAADDRRAKDSGREPYRSEPRTTPDDQLERLVLNVGNAFVEVDPIASTPVSVEQRLLDLFDAAHSTSVCVDVHESRHPGAPGVLERWAAARGLTVERHVRRSNTNHAYLALTVRLGMCAQICVYPIERPR